MLCLAFVRCSSYRRHIWHATHTLVAAAAVVLLLLPPLLLLQADADWEDWLAAVMQLLLGFPMRLQLPLDRNGQPDFMDACEHRALPCCFLGVLVA
jgi:hypothetical protein